MAECNNILKEWMPFLLKLLQKTEEEGTFLNAFYKASITFLPQPDKDTIRKENYKTKSQMDILELNDKWTIWKRNKENNSIYNSIKNNKLHRNKFNQGSKRSLHQKLLDIRYSWAPKSLQMVTASMKLKDACSLEKKIWPT